MLHKHSVPLLFTILLIVCNLASATNYLGFQTFSNSSCSAVDLLTSDYNIVTGSQKCTPSACSSYGVPGFYTSIICVTSVPTVTSPALMTSYFEANNCSVDSLKMVKTYALHKCLMVASDKFQKITTSEIVAYSDSSCLIETGRYSVPNATMNTCFNPGQPGSSYMYSQYYYPSTPAASGNPISQSSTIVKNGASGIGTFSYYFLASVLVVVILVSRE